MQDRFKFRFYDKENEIMVYADTDDELLLYYPDEIYTTWQTYDLSAIENLANNEDYIVMQCTGLKDKNGKLIYEGDIVKETLTDFINEEIIIVVKWDKLNVTYNLENLQNCEREVIGNIYENSELLEVSDEH